MDISEIKRLLLWSLIVNYAIISVWFCVFYFAHAWLYRLHSRWFRLSLETFDAIHYAGIACYKIRVLLLNVVPLTALYLVFKS